MKIFILSPLKKPTDDDYCSLREKAKDYRYEVTFEHKLSARPTGPDGVPYDYDEFDPDPGHWA